LVRAQRSLDALTAGILVTESREQLVADLRAAADRLEDGA
jgi:hypothetical protein